jgi:putative intracellular protease/amidase
MPRVAFLVSSAREIDLGDGPHPTGYWAEEALTSYEKLTEAGAQVVVMTPDGRSPQPDPYSLQPIFHFPDEDRDYFATVQRSFAPDAEDIRVTLHHATELDLMASRRIARRLVMRGVDPGEAHATVCRAARIAWQQDCSLVDVMIGERLDHQLGEAALRAAVDDLDVVCRAVAEDRRALLDDIDGFGRPGALTDLTDAEIDSFHGIFVPGGHAAMVDLPESDCAGDVLRRLHAKGAPIAALCHGPAVLLSAPERPDGQWLFEGYRLTAFTDEEEHQNAIGRRRLSWYLADALQNAGAILDDAASPWTSHVVVDRNLITGQNPYSTDATVGALLRALAIGPTAGR